MKYVFDKLWPELRLHKRTLFWVMLVGALTSALKAVTPELIRQLQIAWTHGDRVRAYQLPFVVALVWSISGVGRFYHIAWMKFASDLVAVNLRRRLMNKYLSLNLSFHQKFVSGSGGLISRMINDINVIQGGIHKVADVLREPFMAVFALGYVVYLDWRLTLFVGAASPIVMTIMKNLARSLRKYGRNHQQTMEDLTKTLKESLDGTRIVQSFNLENEMRRRFEAQSVDYIRNSRAITIREEVSGPVSETLAAITLAVILVYIGNQILAGTLTVGDFIGFSFAVGLLQDSIKKMQDGYIRIQQASVALERLYAILDDTNTIPLAQNAKSFPLNWQKIEFRNVSFKFDQELILKNINLTVQRGELVAIVGSSGGGKSTLVNLLPRFFDPSEGEILIDNIPIKDLDLTELRSKVGLVSQDVFLFGDTIERNIHAGDFSKEGSGIERAAKLANASTFIAKTPQGFDTRIGDMGSNLSGGEKQRLSIARAIFKDAPILVLDEATSALDSESEREVQKGLDELMQGRTAFVIAHRLSTIAKATRILVIRKGEIIEQGSHQQLISNNGEYAKFLSLQQSPQI